MLGTPCFFLKTPQEIRFLAGLYLMPSLGWMMFEHVYSFLRELALSNTRFAMGANIVLEVMRGLSMLSVKCMHSIIA